MGLSNVVGWPAATKNYFEELRAEMRKVTWPNRQQVQATTGVVIASVFLFAAYFFLVDTAVNALINKLLHFFTR